MIVLALLACAPAEEPEDRRKALYAELRELVKLHEAEGRYDCCVQVPCSHCALCQGGCACGEGLRKGNPVCEECAWQWEIGQGAEDVDPALVHSFTEAARLRTGKLCGEPEGTAR